MRESILCLRRCSRFQEKRLGEDNRTQRRSGKVWTQVQKTNRCCLCSTWGRGGRARAPSITLISSGTSSRLRAERLGESNRTQRRLGNVCAQVQKTNRSPC